SDHPTKALPLKLAQLVQAELDEYARNKKRHSPAMANDLLKIENGQKFTYSYVGQDGSSATREALLDESDNIWVDVRHKHMKDCIDQLMTDFNKFLDENSTITDKDPTGDPDEVKALPQGPVSLRRKIKR
ncbi:19763_t:CDS:2, partial [Racocetra fulgida]